MKEVDKNVPNPAIEEAYEVADLVLAPLDVQTGFALADPEDPRYKAASEYRTRYGEVIIEAATILGEGSEGEDHIDAILTVTRAIDCYLLDYASTLGSYEGVQKDYKEYRE